MKVVEPVRDTKKIKSIKKILYSQNERDHLLFSIGVNSPFRISDLLEFKIGDLIDENGKAVTHFNVKEKKTGKINKIAIGRPLQRDIENYLVPRLGEGMDQPVFKSRKNGGSISRQHAWKIIKDAAEEVGLKNIGTHSLRKTFGYHCRKSGVDIEILMELLNHSSTRETLRYIGIIQDEKDQAVLALNL